MKALKVTFETPQHGYWDGGAKTGGTFTVDAVGRSYLNRSEMESFKLTPGTDIKWGCWHLNFWFMTKSGRNWDEAARIGAAKLKRMLGVPATVEIIDEGVGDAD